MTFLNENFGKELQRMSELAGLPNKNINENLSKEPSTKPSADEEPIESDEEDSKVLKEQDDLLGDLGDIFNIQNNNLQGKPTSGDLNKDLKAAMVLNNVAEYQAALLDLYTKYNPKTAGAKIDTEKGTLYTKRPIQKLPGAIKDINRMKDLGSTIDGDDEKLKHVPVSWGEDPERKSATLPDKKSLAKWQPLHKDESIISYNKQTDKYGHETFTLSDRGKQQLEYLERMFSDRPLTPNGNPDIDIESALLDDDFLYKNVVIANAEKIIRDFFNKAVVPIIAHSLKRSSAAPKDSQFERFVRAGVDHAIDQTKLGKYNSSKFSNYGAWFMQVVKHKVIDLLKSQTTFSLDTTHVYDMLSNLPGPLKIDSQLNPDEATGNYDSVETSKNTFTKDGLEKNYFTYVYNKPENALADLEAKAVKTDTGYKKSPLRAQYLKEPGMFYKSYMEHIPAELIQQPVEPAYFEKYEDVPMRTVLKIAKDEVQNILSQIARTLVTSGAKVNESVVLSGRENAKWPTLTKGKRYQVIEKGQDPVPGGGIPKSYYIVKDDTGNDIKVSARALKTVDSLDSSVISYAKENPAALVEILKLLLQYGRMKPVYTKTVYIPKAEGGWIKKNVGEPVAKDKNGSTILPYKSNGKRYPNIDDAPIEYVWDSGKYAEEVGSKLVNDFHSVAEKKGIPLPASDAELLTIMNDSRNKLRKFFGFSTLENPIIKQNRDILKSLLDNLSKSQEAERRNIAEGSIRKAVREMISEKFKKKNEEKKALEEISDEAQDWVSKKIAFLISKEGLSQKQAAGKAYGMARQKGYKIPKK